jgi:molybdopterin biosynthesis enzyme
VKLQGFQKLTLIDKALEMWLSAFQIGAPKVAVVSLKDALGRVLADLINQPWMGMP